MGITLEGRKRGVQSKKAMLRLINATQHGAVRRWGGPSACVATQLRLGKRWLSTTLSLNEFHEVADQSLECMMDRLGPVEDSVEDVDISYAVCA
jgi:hypothetical protein